MTTKPRTAKTSDAPDLSDSMYCEHKRTRRVCEDCQAAAKRPTAAASPSVA